MTDKTKPARSGGPVVLPLRVRPLVFLACYRVSLMLFSAEVPWLVVGGAEEIRTPDLRLAKAALSQLSYGPFPNVVNSQYATPCAVAAMEHCVRTESGMGGGPFWTRTRDLSLIRTAL